MHYFSCFTVIACFFLIIAGALVTSTGSGLAVPDWPLSFGQFFPRLEGGVLYEHGHRIIAGSVAILTAVLALWVGLKESRRPIKILGFAALGAVLLQALLGGLTVLYKLPTPISVAHACLAQIFFCLLVSLAVLTSPEFSTALPRLSSSPQKSVNKQGKLWILQTMTLATVAALFAQLALGAWMRHSGAALAIPDFPLAFGRLVPPLDDPLVRIHFAHRIGAGVVSLFIFGLTAFCYIYFRTESRITRLAIRMINLLALQITLGALAVLLRKPVWISTAHVAVGALMLATAVVLALRIFLLTGKLFVSVISNEAKQSHLGQNSFKEIASAQGASQ